MKVSRRSATVLRVSSAALLGAAIAGVVATGPDANSGPAGAIAISSCQEWMCGTNHNQVVL
jgi:hypothetical protein